MEAASMPWAVCRLHGLLLKEKFSTHKTPSVQSRMTSGHHLQAPPWDPRKAGCWQGIAVAMPLESFVLVLQYKWNAFGGNRIHGHMTGARVCKGHCTWLHTWSLPCSLGWTGNPSSSMPPPPPQWGALLRRQVADTHQILEFCCWQETWKTESQLLFLYLRNQKSREMKRLARDHTTYSRVTDFQASPLSWNWTTPSLNTFKSFHGLSLPKRIGANVRLKCPDSVALQLPLDC